MYKGVMDMEVIKALKWIKWIKKRGFELLCVWEIIKKYPKRDVNMNLNEWTSCHEDMCKFYISYDCREGRKNESLTL